MLPNRQRGNFTVVPRALEPSPIIMPSGCVLSIVFRATEEGGGRYARLCLQRPTAAVVMHEMSCALLQETRRLLHIRSITFANLERNLDAARFLLCKYPSRFQSR
jgi:hypothetical protein